MALDSAAARGLVLRVGAWCDIYPVSDQTVRELGVALEHVEPEDNERQMFLLHTLDGMDLMINLAKIGVIEILNEIDQSYEEVSPEEDLPWTLRVGIEGRATPLEWGVDDGERVFDLLCTVDTDGGDRFARLLDSDQNAVHLDLDRILFIEVPTELVDRGRELDEHAEPVGTPYRRRPLEAPLGFHEVYRGNL